MAIFDEALRKRFTTGSTDITLGAVDGADHFLVHNTADDTVYKLTASNLAAAVASVGNFTELAQDAVGAALANSARITLAYVDGTPSITADLVADSVDNTYLANMAASRIKGRAESAGTGDPTDLTPAQVVAIIDGEAVTWTAQATFTAGSGALVLANTGGPILRLSDTDAASSQKNVRVRNLNGSISVSTEDDSGTAITTAVTMTNVSGAWTNLTYGNTTDNTTFTFLGTGAATFGGDIKLGLVGKGLYVKEGTNATMGVVTLVAGAAVVATTKVTANSRIFLTCQALGTVAVPVPRDVTARVAGTSFTITSSNVTDTSTIAWLIAEPA